MQPVVIVPYRDRATHLHHFIPAVRRYLPHAEIVVVEQGNSEPFNKGWLVNIGFLETERHGGYWIMHDVDTLPVEADYSNPDVPTHIATRCSQFNYEMPYPEYFGGVILFKALHFRLVNGFVNSLRGWGAEDDILYNSFVSRTIPVVRREGTFVNLPHERNVNKEDYDHNVKVGSSHRDYSDGLTSCRYKIKGRVRHTEYLHIMADYC